MEAFRHSNERWPAPHHQSGDAGVSGKGSASCHADGRAAGDLGIRGLPGSVALIPCDIVFEKPVGGNPAMKFLKNASMTVRLLIIGTLLAVLLSAYVKQQAPSIMTNAAKNFLNSLEPWQKTAVSFKMEDEERSNWFYTPVPRKGLALHDMKPYQRQLAMAMIAAGLSQRGFIKVVSIMSLDEILLTVEPTPRRDPDNYYISIFGDPSETGQWGYRVEGHHVSQNYTLANGKVQDAPSFFGSNPAEVMDGPRKGLRVLANEEDLALAVVNSLTPDQRKVAIFDAKAPSDVITTNSRQAALNGQPNGLNASAMTAPERAKLQDLLDEYCSNMPDEIAA